MRTTIDKLHHDIWQEVFEYFNALELFFSLIHITREADDVLFNRNHRLHVRGLLLDAHIHALPEKNWFDRVISVELHQKCSRSDIQQCLELRSLKLIGHPQWIIDLLRKISHVNVKLEQLTLVVPGIGLLHNLVASTSPLLSLRRLEIHGDELEERIKTGTSFLQRTKIEQFIFHSCSPVSWNDLSYLFPALSDIRFLDITLIHLSKYSFCPFIFSNLHSVSLMLLEVPFASLIQLLTTMPLIKKLRLSGLVDAEGFVISNKWLNLFEFCSSLIKITINVSLQHDTNFYYNEAIQTILREMNLDFRRTYDDCEHYLNQINQHHWWNLSGTVIKQDSDQKEASNALS